MISIETFTMFAKTADQCGDKLLGIIPQWYKYLQLDDNCNVNLNFPDDLIQIWKIGLALVEILLRVGGLVAIGFIIYGGFMFVTSQGEPEGIKKAKNTVLNALIGAVITVVASSVVTYIAGRF
ncbi:MAG: pilin [Candidatus Saccharibacteria bacterium]